MGGGGRAGGVELSQVGVGAREGRSLPPLQGLTPCPLPFLTSLTHRDSFEPFGAQRALLSAVEKGLGPDDLLEVSSK